MAYRKSQTLYLQGFFWFSEFVLSCVSIYRFATWFFVISWVSGGFVGFLIVGDFKAELQEASYINIFGHFGHL